MNNNIIGNQHNGFEFVKIGDTKWATCNVGAEKPTDTGLYFQWGDRKGYTADEVGKTKIFDFTHYKHYNGKRFIKYNEFDKKRVLDLCDDAAFAYMGQGWKMPTANDFNRLIDNTIHLWTDSYKDSGVRGILLTDRTDASKELFFPDSNYCHDQFYESSDGCCCYWTSSRQFHDDSALYQFLNNTPTILLSAIPRYFGFVIRGVLTV